MRLKKTSNVVKIAVPIMLVIILVLFALMNSLMSRSQVLHQESTELIILSNEMLHNNDYLVKLMREYAATQNNAALREYETILNDYDSLDGKLDRMVEIGLSADEQRRVDTLLSMLDDLAAIEDDAFAAFDAGDGDLAFSIIFGDEYAKSDRELAAQTKMLIADITVRTTAEIEAVQNQEKMWLIIIGLFMISVMVGGFALSQILSGIVKPIVLLSSFMTKAGTTGDINVTHEEEQVLNSYMSRKDEIGQLIAGSGTFIDHVIHISQELESVAGGDLTTEIEVLSNTDTIGQSLHHMVDSLNAMFGDINASSVQVSIGAKQIADGSQLLAQGSTEQASSIEHLSSSMSVLTRKTKDNSERAGQAALLADTIKRNAEKGSRQMDEMTAAVKEINDASQSIQKVMKVIDDIAFQTNILALNAAVEAARAGQHGKGFAVVAEEVRSLASKSADAARETGAMIENSMEKAELGSRIAGETAASLVEIVSGINESNQVVSEIARSIGEQATGIEQINSGIDQVASVVQQNSATAEQSAAASEEMSGQSAMLEELVAQFKLKEQSAGNFAPGAGHKKQLAMPEKTSTSNGEFGKY
ncbi:MAG: methyl-accepting chemotaxis protein [Oscillospiraceae bacterium]|nr:methyl-accepting chemotaxis protein [Oscillospiraceae bacterium]